MPGHDIIVVGASAGGVEALINLARDLPHDLPAAVFVVLHIPARSPSMLPGILKRAGVLEALHPTDGMNIKYGRIYIAPPDRHLLIERGYVRIVRGPKENRHRPAIDPLLRSAAVAYGPRVVGVILSGALDDGTAGLLAVKQRGGTAIAQDPQDALYPDMPQSARAHVHVDYCPPISAIGPLLVRLSHEAVVAEEASSAPKDMTKEVRIAAMEMNPLNEHEQLGKLSAFGCPECGGVLWEMHDGDLLRFRCRTGHAFSPESVLAEQSEAPEKALWVALKTLEERASLSRRLARQAGQQGRHWIAEGFEKRLQEAEEHARLLRQILIKDKEPADVAANIVQENGQR